MWGVIYERAKERLTDSIYNASLKGWYIKVSFTCQMVFSLSQSILYQFNWNGNEGTGEGSKEIDIQQQSVLVTAIVRRWEGEGEEESKEFALHPFSDQFLLKDSWGQGWIRWCGGGVISGCSGRKGHFCVHYLFFCGVSVC